MFFRNSPELSLFLLTFLKGGGVGVISWKKDAFDVHKIPIVTNLALQKLHEQCHFSSY